jgi:hypothetical protein
MTPSTKVPSASIAYPAVPFQAIQVLTPGGVLLVQLDAATLMIDTSGPLPIFRGIQPKPDQVDLFAITDTPPATFTMTATAAAGAPVLVYRNGLLMALNADYTIAGQVVTFLPAQGTAVGDNIQLVYRPQ